MATWMNELGQRSRWACAMNSRLHTTIGSAWLSRSLTAADLRARSPTSISVMLQGIKSEGWQTQSTKTRWIRIEQPQQEHQVGALRRDPGTYVGSANCARCRFARRSSETITAVCQGWFF